MGPVVASALSLPTPWALSGGAWGGAGGIARDRLGLGTRKLGQRRVWRPEQCSDPTTKRL